MRRGIIDAYERHDAHRIRLEIEHHPTYNKMMPFMD
jgi:hypothetical protein